jgi:hypothetical protein
MILTLAAMIIRKDWKALFWGLSQKERPGLAMPF